MTWAALRLFAATGSDAYLDQAVRWTEVLDRHYWDDASGGYFTSADDTGDVIVRLKSAADDAVPNANAIQLSNLVVLAALTGESRYNDRARDLIKAFSGAAARSPYRPLRFTRRGTRSRSLGSNSRECCWPPRTAIPTDEAIGAWCSGVYRRRNNPSQPAVLAFRQARRWRQINGLRLRWTGLQRADSMSLKCSGNVCSRRASGMRQRNSSLPR